MIKYNHHGNSCRLTRFPYLNRVPWKCPQIECYPLSQLNSIGHQWQQSNISPLSKCLLLPSQSCPLPSLQTRHCDCNCFCWPSALCLGPQDNHVLPGTHQPTWHLPMDILWWGSIRHTMSTRWPMNLELETAAIPRWKCFWSVSRLDWEKNGALGHWLVFLRVYHHLCHHCQCVTVFLMKMAFVGGMLLEITMALSSMPSSALNMASVISWLPCSGNMLMLSHSSSKFSTSSYNMINNYWANSDPRGAVFLVLLCSAQTIIPFGGDEMEEGDASFT